MIELNMKQKVIAGVVVVIISFCAGRATVSETIKTDIKTTEQDKKQDVVATDTQTDKHKTTTVVESTKPTGEKQVTTTVVEDTTINHKTDTTQVDTSSNTSDSKKEVIKGATKTNISALAGLNINGGLTPAYGIAVTHEILGPLTIGAFGLSTGVGGLSVGISF